MLKSSSSDALALIEPNAINHHHGVPGDVDNTENKRDLICFSVHCTNMMSSVRFVAAMTLVVLQTHQAGAEEECKYVFTYTCNYARVHACIIGCMCECMLVIYYAMFNQNHHHK